MNTLLHDRSIVYLGLTFASTESESFYRKSCVIISHMLDQLRNLLTIFVAKIV